MLYEKELIRVLQKATAEAKAEGKMEVAKSMLEAGICFEEIHMFTDIAEEDIVREMERDDTRLTGEQMTVNMDLERRLKEWRHEHYKALNLPSYMVMQNKTLKEIAVRIPHSREELMAIKGFGSTSWEKYGKEILAITSEF